MEGENNSYKFNIFNTLLSISFYNNRCNKFIIKIELFKLYINIIFNML